MNCRNCGHRLAPESLFCNRCGSKVQRAVAPRRPAHLKVPPPRPARRAPIIPSVSDPEPYDDYEDDYSDYYPEDYQEEFPDKEQVIFRINPAFYEVGLTYFWAVALSLILTALIALAKGPLSWAVIGAAVFFIWPIIRHIEHSHTVYTLTNIKVEIRSGVFSTSTQNIPLRHIQDVTVSETLKERLIGIGDILIDSAALESKVAMNNIRNPRQYADLILEQLQYWY